MQFKAANKYHQMMRSYEKRRRVGANTGNSISNVAGKDATEEFFTQCYHFKDWLKKELPRLSQQIEDHITSSSALSVAADYCNSFKHAGLDKQPRSGETLVEIMEHTRMELTPQGFVGSAEVEIRTASKTYRASDVAADCIRDWDAFLRSNNITVPAP